MNKNLFIGILIGFILGVVVVGYLAVIVNPKEQSIEQLQDQLNREQIEFQQYKQASDSAILKQDSLIILYSNSVDSLKKKIAILKSIKYRHHEENNNLSANDAVILLRNNISTATRY